MIVQGSLQLNRTQTGTVSATRERKTNDDSDQCGGIQAYGLQLEDWGKSALSVVVVGASGDLARKKIFPALYALYHEGMLPEVRSELRDAS